MREIIRYMLQGLEEDPRYWRSLRKVRSVREYEGAVRRIFDSAELRKEPAFSGFL